MADDEDYAVSAQTVLACDYLYDPAPPEAIKAAGYSAVLTYLRVLTPTKAQAILDAGLGLVPIFETTADRALDGYTAGFGDGQATLAQCKALGQPTGTAVAFNVADFKPVPAQLALLSGYVSGFLRGLGAEYMGVPYGTGYAIFNIALGGNLWWQNAEDDQTVPGNVVQPKAALYQRVTPTLAIAGAAPGSWDEDVVVNTATIPWWTNPTPIPAPTPAPTPAPAPIPAPIPPKEATGMKWGIQTFDNALWAIIPGPTGLRKAHIVTMTDVKALEAMGAVPVAFTAAVVALMPTAGLETGV